MYDIRELKERPILKAACQPEVYFSHTWAVVLLKRLRKMTFVGVKTLRKKNIIAFRHIKREGLACS